MVKAPKQDGHSKDGNVNGKLVSLTLFGVMHSHSSLLLRKQHLAITQCTRCVQTQEALLLVRMLKIKSGFDASVQGKEIYNN